MAEDAKRMNFVLQQGLDAPAGGSCSLTYSALQFQPRIIGGVVLIGTIVQSAPLFAVLAAVLLWNAFVPRWNLFDAVYNALLASRSGYRLQPAPAPRRFAQFAAGVLSAAIAVLIASGYRFAAIAIELVLLAAIAALVFGGFCAGSYIFHLLRGRRAFAQRTLPWSRQS